MRRLTQMRALPCRARGFGRAVLTGIVSALMRSPVIGRSLAGLGTVAVAHSPRTTAAPDLGPAGEAGCNRVRPSFRYSVATPIPVPEEEERDLRHS
jgi:hypothetical protein